MARRVCVVKNIAHELSLEVGNGSKNESRNDIVLDFGERELYGI